jgi:hypothetical protein
VYEASERDYRIAVVEDGVSGLYEQAKTELGDIGVSVLRTEQVLHALREATVTES